MSYITDQRKFLRKICTSDNSVIRSFLFCVHEYGKILSRYSIQNLCSSIAELKRSLWQYFVDTAILVLSELNCNPLFVLLCGVLCECFFCVLIFMFC